MPRRSGVQYSFDLSGSCAHNAGSSHSEATSYNPDLPNQPFELVALEVALKEICQSYARAEKQLDATVNPACDALLKKVLQNEGSGHSAQGLGMSSLITQS